MPGRMECQSHVLELKQQQNTLNAPRTANTPTSHPEIIKRVNAGAFFIHGRRWRLAELLDIVRLETNSVHGRLDVRRLK